MAETKTSISELTAATTVAATDLLFVSQQSGSTWNSRKATVSQLPFGQGTITGITMNGASKGSSGVVDLGTVLTAHQSLTGYVSTSRTVAGQQLTANVTAATISSAIGLGSYSLTSHTHSNYVPTSRTVAGQQLTANVTAATISSAIGLGSYSLTSHTHSQYLPNNDDAVVSKNASSLYLNVQNSNNNGDAYIYASVANKEIGLYCDKTYSCVYNEAHEYLLPSAGGTLALEGHVHGNITSAGALQTTDVAIANGDKLVVTDASNSSKVARTSLAFDGSTTTQFLSKKGTWETALTAHQSLTGYVSKAELKTALSSVGQIPGGDGANLENTIAKFNALFAALSALTD